LDNHARETFEVVGGQIGPVPIAFAQVCHQNARAIRRLPPEFGWPVEHPAPNGGDLDPKSAQDLGDLSDVTERIGHVPDHHLGTKFTGCEVALLQVADVRFGTHQEHIRQDVPGADDDPPFANVLAEDGFFFRAHVQVILQNDGLTIEHEVFELRVLLKDVEHPVH
jgi:hypothetical protein